MAQRVAHEVLEDAREGLGIGIHGKPLVLEVHARLPSAPLERGELPHQHIGQRRQHGFLRSRVLCDLTTWNEITKSDTVTLEF